MSTLLLNHARDSGNEVQCMLCTLICLKKHTCNSGSYPTLLSGYIASCSLALTRNRYYFKFCLGFMLFLYSGVTFSIVNQDTEWTALPMKQAGLTNPKKEPSTECLLWYPNFQMQNVQHQIKNIYNTMQKLLSLANKNAHTQQKQTWRTKLVCFGETWNKLFIHN